VPDKDVDWIRGAALTAANAARAELGFPPVDHLYKGVRKDELACPITNTVYDDDIDRNKYWIETSDSIVIYSRVRKGDEWDIELPLLAKVSLSSDANEFVTMFDNGEFPELIAENG
jgi:hypothetical protein